MKNYARKIVDSYLGLPQGKGCKERNQIKGFGMAIDNLMKTYPNDFWDEVDSSNIKKMRYNVHTKEMDVMFKKGEKVYRYKKVEYSEYKFVLDADSVGAAFIERIKNFPDRYPFKKL